MSQNEKILSIISKWVASTFQTVYFYSFINSRNRFVNEFRIFGIPVVLDDVPSQSTIDFIFAKYCTGSTENHDDNGDDDDAIDESVIKAYLDFVCTIQTVFDEDAFAMLKYYFIVTRAIRPSKYTDIPCRTWYQDKNMV